MRQQQGESKGGAPAADDLITNLRRLGPDIRVARRLISANATSDGTRLKRLRIGARTMCVGGLGGAEALTVLDGANTIATFSPENVD